MTRRASVIGAIAAAIGLLANVWPSNSAMASCAKLQFCGGDQTQQPELIREPGSSEPWWPSAVLPSSPYLLLSRDYYLTQIAAAMAVYTDANDWVPKDYIAQDYTVADYKWIWTSQSLVARNPNTRTGIPGASTTLGMADASHPCRITSALVAFAYDPHDLAGHYLCWGVGGQSLCGSGVGVLDFETAAIHEYGHALGLAHSDESGTVMYPALVIDEVRLALAQCEQDLIDNVYVENFGPSVLERFDIQPVTGPAVRCTWRASVERGCRAYRLSRSGADGVATVLADSVFCQGAGFDYAVVDSTQAVGMQVYTLSVVDSVAPGLYREKALAIRKYDFGGGLPMASALRSANVLQDAQPGYPTAEAAVEALGAAICARDDAGRARATADGFGYYSKNGMYWGRAIDNILEEAMKNCLATSDSTVDSLAFKPVAVRMMSSDLCEITANALYSHRCGGIVADWDGRVLAIVERRTEWDGWRVRQVVEVW